MRLHTLALKNLRRHRVRSILTVAGIAISAITLFSILSFNSGYDRALKEEISGSGIHIYVSREGCPLEAASLIIHGGEIPEYLDEGLLPQVQSISGVRAAGGMLIATAITGGMADLFYGITPEVRSLKPNWRLKGQWFQDGGSAVLGAKVAAKMKKGVGDTVEVPSVGRSFKVTGVLEPTNGEDDGFYYLPLATAQELFGKPAKLTAVGIQLDDVTTLAQVRRDIEKLPGAYVVPAEDMSNRVLEIVGGTKSIMFAIMVIVLVVAGLGVFNIVLMATFERREEFGYLRCVGAGRGSIFRMIVIETLALSLLGFAAGLGVGWAASSGIDRWIRHFVAYVPSGRLIRPDLWSVLITAGVVLALGLLAGLYPGYRASSVPPMEAIRSE
ncbi:MAG: ABC transporter permease [Actinobacteria bacterium]|nr:ABC transporter permease [Actinomycetota bacterium]MBU1942614.1 ABC transporter permease [Actinomycetota bacterium]MBU2688710.1 ABC transporter permease [Actinomycetota bacterium]